jgi:deoxyinosine 3'endonuclease (endonuclease V)
LHKGGDIVNLEGNSGRIWGAALRSTTGSINPIIVSVGHRISLETSIRVVKACISKYRIPEPVRLIKLNIKYSYR